MSAPSGREERTSSYFFILDHKIQSWLAAFTVTVCTLSTTLCFKADFCEQLRIRICIEVEIDVLMFD